MSRGFGAAKRSLPGNHRDPMDFNKVGQEMGIGRKKDQPIPLGVQGPAIDVQTLAGFAFMYLAKHYDRLTMSVGPKGEPRWSPFHVDMWQQVCSSDECVAIAAPREHAKSTAITLAYGLANLLFRCEDYIVLVSDTFEGQAVEHVRDYSRELKENTELRDAFHIRKLVKDGEGDLIVQFEDDCLARVKGLGMEGAIRGLKWRGKRPGLLLIDDAENPELVDSKNRREKSLNWLMKDLIPAMRKGGKVRMVGTILHHDAALARFCRDSAWRSKIYRAHRAFNDFSEILWPEQWPEERLRKTRQRFINQQNSDGYSQEYLNDPISPVDAYFRPDDLLECEDRDLAQPGEYYIGWDFAVSKEEKRDFTAWSVWKVDFNRRKIKVDAWKGRIDALEIVNLMLKLDRDWEPKLHFVEKGTIEKAIEPFLDERMRLEERYLNLVKVTRNKDKETFAKPLQAMVRRHDLTFNKKMDIWLDVEEEYLRFLKGTHDDIVDSDSIIAQGLREITEAPTEDEIEEDKWLRDRAPVYSPFAFDGRNQTTGY